MNRHFTEEELTLYYYGEARRREDIDAHLGTCTACATTYKEIAATLAMIATHDAPALPAGCDRCGRAIGGHRARRSRAKPHRDRAQPVAHQRGRSGTDSATHRCGGAALQGPGARRRTASARRGADTTNQLTTMDIKHMFATTLLLSGVFAVNATAAIDAGVLRRSVLDTRERSACGPSERECASEAAGPPARGLCALGCPSGGGAPRAIEYVPSASARGSR